MSVLVEIGVSLVGSVLFAALGFVLARGYDSVRTRRMLGHVYALLGSAHRITVVFPRSTLPRAQGRPDNTVWMSLTDGAAIARIGVLCRDARPKTDMVLVPPDTHQHQDGPFVMIGNPADYPWTRKWIADNFPSLRTSAEEHYVAYEQRKWETLIDGDNKVTQDFGFIAVGQTENSHRFALLWGASEFGANIATRAFSELSPRTIKRDEYRGVLAGESWLFVARAQIVEFGVRTDDNKIRIESSYPGEKQTTRSRPR